MDLLANKSGLQRGCRIYERIGPCNTEKNVNAIIKSAKDKFKLETNLVDLKDALDVQNSPCAFGSFCLIYDGEILSYHPISKAQFENIMKKVLP